MSMTVGEALIARLEEYGVDTIFGIPGVHTIEMYRGLKESSIRHITPRHEQGAGFMADGYARASGKPGVALIISGPGVTNILTAMGQAYSESIPMLVISAVNAHGRMGSGEGWLHELQNQSLTASGVAAFSRSINTPQELAPALDQAFAVFQSGRPRPVHIEIPINVLSLPAGDMPAVPQALSRPQASHDALMEAVKMLEGAQKPLIIAGGGAAGPVRRIAEALDAPVIMTTNGRGHLGPEHPLAVAVNPTSASVRGLLADADVVLALGTEIGPTDFDWDEDGGMRINGRLIRIDIDPQAIRRGAVAALGIVGDAGPAAEVLAKAITPRAAGNGAARAEAGRASVKQQSSAIQGDLVLLERLRQVLPDLLMVGDSTQLSYAGNIAYNPEKPGSYWSSASGFGTLGYGMPAAIGAAIGAPDRPVIALSGDGGLLFTIGEMVAAAEEKVCMTMILHDNSGYGEIKTHMLAAGVSPLGVDLATPDFVAIAKACGWEARDASSAEDLVEACVAARNHQGPTMIRLSDEVRAEFAALI